MEGEELARVEEEFGIFIAELRREPGLDRLTVEYMNIFNALKASQNRVNGQKKKYTELKEALLIESVGVEGVLKMSQSDDLVRRRLLKQIDTIRGAIEKLKEREAKNEQKLLFLTQSITAIEDDIKKAELLSKHIGVLDEKASELDLLSGEVEELLQREEASRAGAAAAQTGVEEVAAERQAAGWRVW